MIFIVVLTRWGAYDGTSSQICGIFTTKAMATLVAEDVRDEEKKRYPDFNWGTGKWGSDPFHGESRGMSSNITIIGMNLDEIPEEPMDL